jgi:menaquinone-9 beta-reductase
MRVDVLIIGGSLAGATCARELTRFGIDSLALERDVFPRPKVCGGFLSPGAVDSLEKIGLLDKVREAGAIDVERARIHAGSLQIEIPFFRNGLGISRSALDYVVADGAPVQQATSAHSVRETQGGFIVETGKGDIYTPVLIDAAGKLSRFTRRTPSPEFGIQYFENDARGAVMDFWFFQDGYGGAVSVEGARSNFCFLIKKDALGRYTSGSDRLVTGPLAYDTVPGVAIAIGDAAGMIDPFCGEGMHHAIDSGMIAARIVANGLHSARTYAEIRRAYDDEWSHRWSRKRLFLRSIRWAVRRSWPVRLGLGFKPEWFLRQLWATIPS